MVPSVSSASQDGLKDTLSDLSMSVVSDPGPGAGPGTSASQSDVHSVSFGEQPSYRRSEASQNRWVNVNRAYPSAQVRFASHQGMRMSCCLFGALFVCDCTGIFPNHAGP